MAAMGLRQISLSFLLFFSLILPTTADDIHPGPLTSTSLHGRLLVATPDLDDPNFRHTVVLIVHHSDAGAMGLVINRMMAKGPVAKLLESAGLEGEPRTDAQMGLFYGGPVDPDMSLVLHDGGYRNATTFDLGEGLALSSAEDVLKDVADGRGPANSLLVIGHAGWVGQQLEHEIQRGSWYVIDFDQTFLFDDDIETKWERALARRGEFL